MLVYQLIVLLVFGGFAEAILHEVVEKTLEQVTCVGSITVRIKSRSSSKFFGVRYVSRCNESISFEPVPEQLSEFVFSLPLEVTDSDAVVEILDTSPCARRLPYRRCARKTDGRSVLRKNLLPGKKQVGARRQEFKRVKRQPSSVSLLKQSNYAELYGVVDGTLSLKQNEGPYILPKDLVVSENATLTIEQGSKLFFAPNAGIRVFGKLVVRGTITSPVTMDTAQFGQKWNGILILTERKLFELTIEESQSGQEGYLKVWDGEDFRFICRDGWDLEDAKVACRQMGFNAEAPYISEAPALPSIPPVSSYWLSQFACQGPETSLRDCNFDLAQRNGPCSGPASIQCTGSWSGRGQSVRSSMQHLNISNAKNGLQAIGGLPELTDVVVERSEEYGIEIFANFMDSPPDTTEYKIENLKIKDNKRSGFVMHLEFPSLETKWKLTLQNLHSASNGANGIEIDGRGRIYVMGSASFLNAFDGVYSRLFAGLLHIEATLIYGNAKYGARFERGRDVPEPLELTLRDSNVTQHWWGPAVLVNAGPKTTTAIDRNRFWDNSKGAVLVGKIKDSVITFLRNIVWKNYGTTLGFSDVNAKSSIVITSNQFLQNMAHNLKNHSVIFIRFKTFDRSISITLDRNRFRKNTMTHVLWVSENYTTFFDNATATLAILTLSITQNEFKQNLSPAVALIESAHANLSRNVFENELAKCEIKSGPYKNGLYVLATHNYWGTNDPLKINERICGFNQDANLLPISVVPYQENDGMQTEHTETPEFVQGTLVGGVIKTGVTQVEPGKYSVNQSILVSKDSELILSPGTELIFESKKGLAVEGKLTIGGTAEKPVILSGTDGVWLGIMIESMDNQPSSLQNVIVDGAAVGMQLKSGNFQLLNVTISNSLTEGVILNEGTDSDVDFGGSRIVSSGRNGLQIDKYRNSVRIKNLSISNSSGHGIHFSLPVMDINITQVSVRGSGLSAIHIDHMTHGNQTLEINNCSISGHENEAGLKIVAKDYKSIVISNSLFEENTAPSIIAEVDCDASGRPVLLPPAFDMQSNVLRNNHDSVVVDIVLKTCVNANISSNLFSDNNRNGRYGTFKLTTSPMATMGPNSFRVVVQRNVFVDNKGEYTVYLLAMSMYTFFGAFVENQLTDNHNRRAALIAGSPKYEIHYNKLVNHARGHEIEAEYNDADYLDATRNYWGTDSRQSIAERILDSRTYNTRGEVIFEPFLIKGSATHDCAGVNECSQHGQCVGPNTCQCSPGYAGNSCDEFTCEGLQYCNTNGRCIGSNQCQCFNGWSGDDCLVPSCANLADCQGHGQCVSLDECRCFAGWDGVDCSISTGANATACLFSCNGHGVCLADRTCRCDQGYSGNACQLPVCSTDCSGMGTCVAPETCTCDEGFSGESCEVCSLGPGCDKAACQKTCVHGHCDVISKSCICTEPWTGESCETCKPGESCDSEISLIGLLPIIPGAKNVYVEGENFPRPVKGTYYCKFGKEVTDGRYVNSTRVMCILPENSPNNVEFSLAISDSGPIKSVEPIEVVVPQSCEETVCPARSSLGCWSGRCICSSGFAGDACQDAAANPVLDVTVLKQPNLQDAKEGLPVQVQLNTVDTGAADTAVRWILTDGPEGMIVSKDGLLTWRRPVGQSSPINVTVAAVSSQGTSTISWQMNVPISYKAVLDSAVQPSTAELLQIVGHIEKIETSDAVETDLSGMPVFVKAVSGAWSENATVLTSRDGSFVHQFPLPASGTDISVTVRHPGDKSGSGTDDGFRVALARATAKFGQDHVVVNSDGTIVFTVQLENTGAKPLTNVSAQMLEDDGHVTEVVMTTLPGSTPLVNNIVGIGDSILLKITANLTRPLSGKEDEPKLHFIISASEGLLVIQPIEIRNPGDNDLVRIVPKTLELNIREAEPVPLSTVDILNNGRSDLRNVSIRIPENLPIFLAGSSNNTVTLLPDDRVTFVFGHLPSTTTAVPDPNQIEVLANGSIIGSLDVRFVKANRTVLDFTVEVLSEIIQTDDGQYTLKGTEVRLMDPMKGSEDIQYTDQSGFATFLAIRPGYYNFLVTAKNHSTVHSSVLIQSDNTKLSLQLPWIGDGYNVLITPDGEDPTRPYRVDMVHEEMANATILLADPSVILADNRSGRHQVTFENRGSKAVYNIETVPTALIQEIQLLRPKETAIREVSINSLERDPNGCDATLVPINYRTKGAVTSLRTSYLMVNDEPDDYSKLERLEPNLCMSTERGPAALFFAKDDRISISTQSRLTCNCTADALRHCIRSYSPMGACESPDSKFGDGYQPSTLLKMYRSIATCSTLGVNLKMNGLVFRCILAAKKWCGSASSPSSTATDVTRSAELVKQVARLAKLSSEYDLPVKQRTPADISFQPESEDEQRWLKFVRLLERYNAIVVSACYGSVKLGSSFDSFLAATMQSSDGGTFITTSEMSIIKAQSGPPKVNSCIPNLAQKWNNTMTIWSGGTLSPSEPFIDWNKLKQAIDLQADIAKSQLLEPEVQPNSVFAVMDNFVNTLNDTIEKTNVCANGTLKIDSPRLAYGKSLTITVQLENLREVPLENVKVDMRLNRILGDTLNFSIDAVMKPGLSTFTGEGFLPTGQLRTATWSVSVPSKANPEDLRFAVYNIEPVVSFNVDGHNTGHLLTPINFALIPPHKLSVFVFVRPNIGVTLETDANCSIDHSVVIFMRNLGQLPTPPIKVEITGMQVMSVGSAAAPFYLRAVSANGMKKDPLYSHPVPSLEHDETSVLTFTFATNASDATIEHVDVMFHDLDEGVVLKPIHIQSMDVKDFVIFSGLPNHCVPSGAMAPVVLSNDIVHWMDFQNLSNVKPLALTTLLPDETVLFDLTVDGTVYKKLLLTFAQTQNQDAVGEITSYKLLFDIDFPTENIAEVRQIGSDGSNTSLASDNFWLTFKDGDYYVHILDVDHDKEDKGTPATKTYEILLGKPKPRELFSEAARIVEVRIQPNTPVGRAIHTLKPDGPYTGTVKYSLSQPAKYFTVDTDSGDISAATDLASLSARAVCFQVEASDSGLPFRNATLEVRVELIGNSGSEIQCRGQATTIDAVRETSTRISVAYTTSTTSPKISEPDNTTLVSTSAVGIETTTVFESLSSTRADAVGSTPPPSNTTSNEIAGQIDAGATTATLVVSEPGAVDTLEGQTTSSGSTLELITTANDQQGQNTKTVARTTTETSTASTSTSGISGSTTSVSTSQGSRSPSQTSSTATISSLVESIDNSTTREVLTTGQTVPQGSNGETENKSSSTTSTASTAITDASVSSTAKELNFLSLTTEKGPVSEDLVRSTKEQSPKTAAAGDGVTLSSRAPFTIDPNDPDFDKLVRMACKQAPIDKVFELACEIGKIHMLARTAPVDV